MNIIIYIWYINDLPTINNNSGGLRKSCFSSSLQVELSQKYCWLAVSLRIAVLSPIEMYRPSILKRIITKSLFKFFFYLLVQQSIGKVIYIILKPPSCIMICSPFRLLDPWSISTTSDVFSAENSTNANVWK